MHDSPQASLHHAGSMTTGWLLSCLLHGGLAVATILFVQRIQLAPQGKPFQWNVAMVASPSSSAKPASLAEPVTSSALTHQPASSHAKNTPASARPVQPAKTPVSSPPPVPTMEPTPQVSQTHAHSDESNSSAPISSAMSSSSAQPLPPNPSVPLSEQVSSTQALTGTPDSSLAADPLLAPSSSTNASSASASQERVAKVDYGWLTALMAQWIGGLNKRYPAALRTEGVEGKVTLTAMLHEDGSLSDVRVVRTSGNQALDEVALEDVRNGPPITLSRPLERPQMSVRFSISYDLKMAR